MYPPSKHNFGRATGGGVGWRIGVDAFVFAIFDIPSYFKFTTPSMLSVTKLTTNCYTLYVIKKSF